MQEVSWTAVIGVSEASGTGVSHKHGWTEV